MSDHAAAESEQPWRTTADSRRNRSTFDEAMAEAIREEVEGDGGVGERLAARRTEPEIPRDGHACRGWHCCHDIEEHDHV